MDSKNWVTTVKIKKKKRKKNILKIFQVSQSFFKLKPFTIVLCVYVYVCVCVCVCVYVCLCVYMYVCRKQNIFLKLHQWMIALSVWSKMESVMSLYVGFNLYFYVI